MTDQADTLRNDGESSRTLPVAGGDPTGRRTYAASGFAAQMLGAEGQRRGLKGGVPVLQSARRAYLETQWSGRGDRRASAGRVALARI